MKYSTPLIKGHILKRYKRFLADIRLESGEQIIAHVPNTGSMKACWGPEWPCLLSYHDNPKRKLKYTLEMTHNGKTWIGVNTHQTNHLVREALESNWIPELGGFQTLKAEVKLGDSRLDFCLDPDLHPHYIEVKNVTLCEQGQYLFPDAVSIRGQKHLQVLTDLSLNKSAIATMLYIVQREDGKLFTPAKDIDPEYARLLTLAKKSGVQILVYQCMMNPNEVKINKRIEFKL